MRTRYQVWLSLLVYSTGGCHMILSCTLLLPACFPNGAAVFAKRLESAAPFHAEAQIKTTCMRSFKLDFGDRQTVTLVTFASPKADFRHF